LPSRLGEGLILGIAPQQTEPAGGAATPTPRDKPLVGIVVGHWDDNSKDPGAVCQDIPLTEFQVNQTIATLARDLLLKENVDVDLLREFDPKLQGYRANVLISIHADSCDYINAEATGFKVSSALANAYPERAARLTACLRSRYARVTNKRVHNSVTADMTSYHAFEEVDRNTTAVIIETGFLNLDRDLLVQSPEIAARGIADGIMCYLNNESISPTPTAPEEQSQE